MIHWYPQHYLRLSKTYKLVENKQGEPCAWFLKEVLIAIREVIKIPWK